jgi:carbamate kinase
VRIVVALGGNALLQRGEKPDAGIQWTHIRQAPAGTSPPAATDGGAWSRRPHRSRSSNKTPSNSYCAPRPSSSAEEAERGGGAPVTADSDGHLHGVEGVVDKDLTAALLAITLHADRLLVLTDMP